MPDHEWNGLPLLLCERHKLRRKIARHVSVERHKACCPGAIEDREKQQWIFGRFSERFCSLDELTRPFNGRLGLRRRIAFNVRESVNECDLQLDLFATHDRRAGQGRNLVERTPERSVASTSADCASDRCPALPQRLAALSIWPASVQWRANNSGRLSAISANWTSSVSAMRACSARRCSRSNVP